MTFDEFINTVWAYFMSFWTWLPFWGKIAFVICAILFVVGVISDENQKAAARKAQIETRDLLKRQAQQKQGDQG